MRYKKAQDILPAELLEQLQGYIDGAYLYIPRKEENRLAWGDRTQSKRETAARNREILAKAEAGADPAALANEYYLTEKTIRRIIQEERAKN